MPKNTPIRIIDSQRTRAATFLGGSGASGSGVSDHGLLTGLNDDDHAQYLRTDGTRTLTGNMAVDAAVTIDGVDISAHAADINAHHAKAHAITGSDHTVTGSTYQIVGLTGTNTIGLLTPASSPGANAIVKTDGSSAVTLVDLTVTSDLFMTGTLDFGTTGRLRFSNLLMYDRPTESWWQQATGEALVGELLGAQLVMLPATIVSWQDFHTAYPGGRVLSRQTGFSRPYGQNPYAGYDDVNQSPYIYKSWLSSYSGPAVPAALLPMTRVLTVDLAGEAVAYPYEVLQQAGVVNDSVGGQALVVLWTAGTASALDTQLMAEGRDVGAAVAYSRVVGEQTLTFAWAAGRIHDQETGSEWDALGRGRAGPLAGQQLTLVVALNHFWFSWAAFKPETRIYAAAPP